jgi:hypothetical protein
MEVAVHNVTTFVALICKSCLTGGIAISMYIFFLRKFRVTLSGMLSCTLNEVRPRIIDPFCFHDFYSQGVLIHILHIITVPPRQITQVHIIAESPQSRSPINLTYTTSFILQEQGFILVSTYCETSRN